MTSHDLHHQLEQLINDLCSFFKLCVPSSPHCQLLYAHTCTPTTHLLYTCHAYCTLQLISILYSHVLPIPCCSTLYKCHTTPYHTIPYHTIPHHTMPYHTIHTIYRTLPYCAIHHTTIQYSTTSQAVTGGGVASPSQNQLLGPRE